MSRPNCCLIHYWKSVFVMVQMCFMTRGARRISIENRNDLFIAWNLMVDLAKTLVLSGLLPMLLTAYAWRDWTWPDVTWRVPGNEGGPGGSGNVGGGPGMPAIHTHCASFKNAFQCADSTGQSFLHNGRLRLRFWTIVCVRPFEIPEQLWDPFRKMRLV